MQSASARGERSSSKLVSGAAAGFSTSKISLSFMICLMLCCETKMEPGGMRSKPEIPLPTAAGALPSSSSPACVPGQQARSLLSYLCWVLYPGNITHVKVQKTPCGPLSCCEGCLESMNKTHPQVQSFSLEKTYVQLFPKVHVFLIVLFVWPLYHWFLWDFKLFLLNLTWYKRKVLI